MKTFVLGVTILVQHEIIMKRDARCTMYFYLMLLMLIQGWIPPVAPFAATNMVNKENFVEEVPYREPKLNTCRYSSKDWFLQEAWRNSDRMIMLGPTVFQMGSAPLHAIPGDNEEEREISLKNAFWIDKTEVTVEEFAEFVKKTNYSTVAEFYGSSFVFHLEPGVDNEIVVDKRKRGWWWLEKTGVSWKSNFGNKIRNPVVHVSFDDAEAYCLWRGGRLPKETEWEYACRGNSQSLFPWGNELHPQKYHMTNIWQGQFPLKNTEKDGYLLTAPVQSFPSNCFGIYDMIGNVWEWVEGPWQWNQITTSNADYQLNPNVRVQKGGSFLCHRNHCFRYRCGARTKGTRDSTASNLGFRCAADAFFNQQKTKDR